MARTGRGWDAKPPAPRRRRTAHAQEPADTAQSTHDASSAAADQPRRRSLPWSTAAAPQRETPQPETVEGETGDRPVRGRGSKSWGGKGRGGWGDKGSGGQGLRGAAARAAKAAEAAEADAQRDPHELARDICMKQLAVRPRTRAELAAALKKRGVQEEVATAILDRYGEVGMIDDAAFAKAWVTSRHHSRGLAGRALAQELRRKGVEQEVTAEALSELDPETEAQTAFELAMRKLKTTRGEPDAVFRRLLGMLARKGYAGGVAVRAVKDALATRDAELAELIDPDVYEE